MMAKEREKDPDIDCLCGTKACMAERIEDTFTENMKVIVQTLKDGQHEMKQSLEQLFVTQIGTVTRDIRDIKEDNTKNFDEIFERLRNQETTLGIVKAQAITKDNFHKELANNSNIIWLTKCQAGAKSITTYIIAASIIAFASWVLFMTVVHSPDKTQKSTTSQVQIK